MITRVLATSILLKVVGKYPFLFGSRLNEIVSDLPSDIKRFDTLKKYSSARVFENGAEWVSTEVTIRVSAEERVRIQRWVDKKDPLRTRRAPKEVQSFSSLGGYANLGAISINSDLFMGKGRIDVISEVNESFNVSLTSLSAGLCYLTLSFKLSAIARQSLSDVPVRGYKTRYVLESFNPFKIGRAYTIEPPDSQCEKTLSDRAKCVVEQTIHTAFAILRECNIKGKISDCVTVANIFHPSEGPYFDSRGLGKVSSNGFIESDLEESRCYGLVRRLQYGFDDECISANRLEFFSVHQVSKLLSVDAVYIVSKKTEDSSVRAHRYVHISLPRQLSMLIETQKRHQYIAQGVTQYLLKSKADSKTLDALFKASLKIDRLRENLDAIDTGAHFIEESYRDYKNQVVRSQELQNLLVSSAINKRRDLIKSHIEYDNLKWTRRYSKVVFGFILVQIAISVFVVDWTSEGVSNNLMYKNYMELKTILSNAL